MGRAFRSITLLALSALLLLSVTTAAAQSSASDEWEFQIAPLYLWAVDLGGTMTVMEEEVPFEVQFADAFENLEATFTVHFEAWKGDWGLFADVSWLDLGGEMPTPDPEVMIGIDFEQTLLEAGAAYEFAGDTSVIFGVRYTKLDPKITFPMDMVIDESQSWTDAFVGLMWRPQMSDRWNFSGRFDIGAGGSDFVWNAAAIFDYRLGSHTALMFGYRHLDYDYEDSGAGFAYDASQGGPLVALRFFW